LVNTGNSARLPSSLDRVECLATTTGDPTFASSTTPLTTSTTRLVILSTCHVTKKLEMIKTSSFPFFFLRSLSLSAQARVGFATTGGYCATPIVYIRAGENCPISEDNDDV